MERVRITLNVLFIISIVLEMLFFFEAEDVYACFISVLTWIIAWKYALTNRNFDKYPLSTLSIFALIMFYVFLPPIITLSEGKPVCFNLNVPFITYSLQFIYITFLIISFNLSKKIKGRALVNGLRSINFYYIPSSIGIWFLGFVGLLSLIFSNSNSNIDAANLSATDRFLEGFAFMAAIPLIFFSIPKSLKKRIRRPNYIILIFYLIILLICAVLTNRRHAVFTYLLTPLLLWFINKVHEGKLKSFSIKKASLALLVVLISFGPVSDFCLAMSALRSQVSDIKGEELFKRTIDTYQDKEALEMMYRYFSEEQIVFSTIGYTEYYVDNILLNRLCNMKPIDNSVYYATQIDCFYGNDFMLQKMGEKLEYLLPSPILKVFDSHFDKFKESSYGFNDYLIDEANHTTGGGYRVGGDSGICFATFGILFPVFILIFYSIYFYVIDLFWFEDRNGMKFMSVYGLCNIFEYFYIFQSNHGFMDDISFLLRAWPQQILLYIVLINIVKRAGAN